MNIEVGDWVRSYSAGIWQVYRILSYKCINPIDGKEQEKVTVFSKRFVSNSFKRSFKEESCDPSIITKLDEDEQKELDEFIEKNEALYKKFIDYQPKSIDCLYNARVGIPEDRDKENLSNKLQSDTYYKDTEIDPLLTNLGYNTRAMPSWTVQFISDDFRCIDGHLSFKFNRVLGH